MFAVADSHDFVAMAEMTMKFCGNSVDNDADGYRRRRDCDDIIDYLTRVWKSLINWTMIVMALLMRKPMPMMMMETVSEQDGDCDDGNGDVYQRW